MNALRCWGLKVLIVITIICIPKGLMAHGSKGYHCADIMNVFGFEHSNTSIWNWAEFISSEMIDQPGTFYEELKRKHPGFQCKHRLLFHWGYNSLPWNRALEDKVKDYCRKKQAISIADTISLFKSEIKNEQKRRNGLINNKTETLFGFSHGGKDAGFARFFASMAYNVHLVGDYTSDNTDFDGLQPLDEIIGLIIIELRNLDNNKCKSLINDINQINRQFRYTQVRADTLMSYLKNNVPVFIQNAQGGAIKRRLEKNGIQFREQYSLMSRFGQFVYGLFGSGI